MFGNNLVEKIESLYEQCCQSVLTRLHENKNKEFEPTAGEDLKSLISRHAISCVSGGKLKNLVQICAKLKVSLSWY